MLANPKNKTQSLIISGSLDLLLKSVEDQYHASLYDLSASKPTLLIFLRQFGCCFCREALSDIKFALPAIDSAGSRLVLVHMSSEEEASQILASYGLADLSRVSNPDQSLYKSFGLKRSSLNALLAPQVLARAIEAMLNGNPLSVSAGDSLQMPGLFLIHKGRILQAYAPESVDSRPDYVKIVSTVASPVLR